MSVAKDKNRSPGFSPGTKFSSCLKSPMSFRGWGHVRNDTEDKNRRLGFSPGKLRPPPPQKYRVFQPQEVGLIPQADFCPPRQECSGYLLSSASYQAMQTIRVPAAIRRSIQVRIPRRSVPIPPGTPNTRITSDHQCWQSVSFAITPTHSPAFSRILPHSPAFFSVFQRSSAAKKPTTDHRPPTTDHRTTDHRTTDHRPPTTDHRPPTTDHRTTEPPNH